MLGLPFVPRELDLEQLWHLRERVGFGIGVYEKFVGVSQGEKVKCVGYERRNFEGKRFRVSVLRGECSGRS